MALEISIFALILGVAILFYLLGLFSKTHFIFLLGCVLLLGSGSLLFIFDGLVTSRYYDVSGVIQEVIVSGSSIGVWSLALVLISIGLISVLVFDFSIPSKKLSPFHY